MNGKLLRLMFVIFTISCLSPALADGNTDLIKAAGRGDAKSVQSILASGGDVNATNANGWTALVSAAENGHTEVVEGHESPGVEFKGAGS